MGTNLTQKGTAGKNATQASEVPVFKKPLVPASHGLPHYRPTQASIAREMANKAHIKAQLKSAPSPKKPAAPVLKITLGKNGPLISSTNKENAAAAAEPAVNTQTPSVVPQVRANADVPKVET